MRGFTRFVICHVAIVLILVAFGFALSALKISRQGLDMLSVILDPHGIVFGLLLPLLIYALVPTLIIWIILRIVSLLRKTR